MACSDCSWAEDPLAYANLKITGNIIAESCDVDTANLNVHIGDFPQNSFETVGAVSPSREFDIKLLNCSPGISGTYITFSGISDANNADLLALSDTSESGGMASGVAIQVLGNTNAPIALNKPSMLLSLVAGDNDLKFKLRYKATAIPVKPGNATSVMYFDMTYQ